MVRLSDPTTAGKLHNRDMANPTYRVEHERTRFADDVALRVLHYRIDHGPDTNSIWTANRHDPATCGTVRIRRVRTVAIHSG